MKLRLKIWAIIATTIVCVELRGLPLPQNAIRGTVADSVTSERLPGATLTLNGNVSTTDAFGNYQFDYLEDGTYSLNISFIGYHSSMTVVRVTGGETRLISVRLQPATLRLNEITISGASAPDQTMTSINKLDIGLRPLKSSQDILRMIPGVVTAQHAGGGKAEQIFLRGFDIDHGTDIALSVDGIPVNMVSHAHGQGYADLHFITPELIDYVDFNKGPYYSRVGDFNTAGYANFHTKNSLEQSRIKMEAGKFGTYRSLAMIDLLKDNSDQHAFFSAEYVRTNGPFESPQHLGRLNIFGKFHGILGENKILDVSVSSFKSEWDASGQIPTRAVRSGKINRFGSLDNTEGGGTGRTNVNVNLIRLLKDGAAIRNQIYFSKYDFELYSNFTYFLYDSINGDEIKQKEKRNIYGYAGSYEKDFHLSGRSLHFESGVSMRYDHVDNIELSHVKARYTFINSIALGDVDQVNASAYTDATMRLTNRLSMNAGLRVDGFRFQHLNKLDNQNRRSDEMASIVSPKINFYYDVSPNLQVYFKNGIGFHSNDSRVVVAREGSQVLPKAFGTDLGVFVRPIPNLLINTALWQLHMQQEFVYVGDEAVLELSGRTQRYGLDLSLRYQFFQWLFLDIDGNYSYARSIDKPVGRQHIPLAPTFTSAGGFTANFKCGIRMSIRYRFVDERPANEVNSVTALGYFLLDASVSYTIKKFQISMEATNLLNREWNEAQFDTKTRMAGESAGISELTFTPGDPIFIKGGISFLF